MYIISLTVFTFINEMKRGEETAVLVNQIGPQEDLDPRLGSQQRWRYLVTAVSTRHRSRSATIFCGYTHEI